MRLVDADALKDKANDTDYMPTGKWLSLSDIDATPTIDPVKHGEWHKFDSTYYRCSNCGGWLKYDSRSPEYLKIDYKYCPKCGAKMDRNEE